MAIGWMRLRTQRGVGMKGSTSVRCHIISKDAEPEPMITPACSTSAGVGAIYYLIPYNLAMYGINDVFDYASDINNPRKGGIEGALIPPAFHRPLLWLVLASNLPFLILLLAVGTPGSVVAILVSTFAVVAYSAPKLRFKERPVLDSLTSSTHFVSPAVVGLTLAGARIDGGLVMILAAFFAWGVAAHAFGAVQDVVPDREAGIGPHARHALAGPACRGYRRSLPRQLRPLRAGIGR